jgi:hypothetical protein
MGNRLTNLTADERMELNNPIKSPSIKWYKALTLHQKIALKELSVTICGMKWEDFNILFSPRERIEILNNKLEEYFYF